MATALPKSTQLKFECLHLWNQSNNSDYDIVVAIDFGTSYSGYAYSKRETPDTIVINKPWKSPFSAIETHKTPTCVISDQNGKLIHFGYDAQEECCEEDVDGLTFFSNFKMELFGTEYEQGQSMFKRGPKKPSLPLFTGSLEYFKNRFHKEYDKVHPGEAAKLKIRWVLTVPAIWSEVSKGFMRLAAGKAGLLSSKSPNQLVIALEPEAAAIYCLKFAKNLIDARHPTENPVEGVVGSLPMGTRYMIMDCGGGTVDICVHEVISDKFVRELRAASGGPWGANSVNQYFRELLKTILDEDFIADYFTENSKKWFKLDQRFEVYKRNVQLEKKRKFRFSVSKGMHKTFKRMTKSTIERTISEVGVDGIDFEDDEDEITIDYDVIKDKCFKPVLDAIVKHVEEIQKQIPDIKHVFMVGGFSECELLQEEMSCRFGNPCVIQMPRDAGLAVVKGAVHFGHDASIISRRIARRTYGIRVSHLYDDIKHDRSKLEVWEGTRYCKDIFDVIIRKNDEVKLGSRKKIEYLPLQHRQTQASFEIYAVDREHVTYTTDIGVLHVGALNIDMSDLRGGRNRDIELFVQLGNTELTFEAKNPNTGHSDQFVIDFSQ